MRYKYALVMVFVVGLSLSDGAEPITFFEPVLPARNVQVMAHRGAMIAAPENTGPAIELSIKDGVEWVEIDVRLTKDGHHVIFHDGTLEGKTNLSGRVEDHTLAEIQNADVGSKFALRFAGARILTLAETLKLGKNRVNYYLDCKKINPALLAREVMEAEMGRQVVVYDSPEVLAQIRSLAGDQIGLMTKWYPKFGTTDWIDKVRPHAVEINAEDVTESACKAFRDRGIKVQAKVLGAKDDQPEVWSRMIAAGVNWLQTDRAEEILATQALKNLGANRVKVAHHRGAGRYAPENTLEALEKSVRLGADFVEFDIQTTADGGFVVMHDRTLQRTTSIAGQVRDKTLTEISTYSAGAWFGVSFAKASVPTLDEYLVAVSKTNLELYVDAKSIPPEALAKALQKHGLVERSVVYQGADYLEKLREINPQIRRMPPLRDPEKIEAVVRQVKPYAFDTAWTVLSKPLIDRCHALGVKVFSDSIGSHEQISDYQNAAEMGIDLIQSDQPVKVLRALELLKQKSQ